MNISNYLYKFNNFAISAIRMEDVFYEKLELRKDNNRMNNLEYLGQVMNEAGIEFGAGTPYGLFLNI